MHSRWSLYILTLRGITSQSFLFKTASVIFFPPGVIFLKFNSEDGWTRLTLSEAPHYPQVDWFVQSSNFMIIRIKRKHPCVKQYTCWESSKYEIWSPKGQFISLASPSSSSPTTNTHKYAHVRSNSQLLAEIYVLFETPGPSSGFSLCFKYFLTPNPPWVSVHLSSVQPPLEALFLLHILGILASSGSWEFRGGATHALHVYVCICVCVHS